MGEVAQHNKGTSIRSMRQRMWTLFKWLCVLLGLLLLYSIAVEPFCLVVEHIEAPLPYLPPSLDGMTIVQLSDIHYKLLGSAVQLRAVITRTNRLHPDLIVLTGDYANSYLPAEITQCARLLGQLHARYGVYAVLGNHEYWYSPVVMANALRAQGIHVLINQSVHIPAVDGQLRLVGLDDAWMGDAKPYQAFRGVTRHEPVIVLSHEPDYFYAYATSYPVHLQLSGHSHGGQIRLPYIGALLLPSLGRQFPMGLYHQHDSLIYTTRGTGTVDLAVRFNCRPEITHITLRRQSPSQERP